MVTEKEVENVNYIDITKNFAKNNKSNSHKILDKNYFKDSKGFKYKVDGKNVVLDYSKKEKEEKGNFGVTVNRRYNCYYKCLNYRRYYQKKKETIQKLYF